MPLTRTLDDDRRAAHAARADAGLDDLAAALAAADPAERRAAARACVAHPALAPLLADRLADEADASVRTALCHALSRIGTPAAVRGLVHALQSSDAAVRAAALEALHTIPEATTPVLEPLLSADDAGVRRFVVEVLPALRHPMVATWALQVVRHDPDPNVAAAAAELLAEVGGPEAVAALTALPARFPGEPFVAFAADHARARVAAS